VPELTPFLRDIALMSVPEEWSLAKVAAVRPLVMTYDPKWQRVLARHLVPTGLFATYETEPRTTSDRRIALDAESLARDRLASVLAIAPAAVVAVDLELRRVTAQLLRERIVALAASHDRELLSRAAEEIRAFASDDATASEILRRAEATRGAIDVKDVVP
jgi:hypothetical protein